MTKPGISFLDLILLTLPFNVFSVNFEETCLDKNDLLSSSSSLDPKISITSASLKTVICFDFFILFTNINFFPCSFIFLDLKSFWVVLSEMDLTSSTVLASCLFLGYSFVLTLEIFLSVMSWFSMETSTWRWHWVAWTSLNIKDFEIPP